MAAFNTYNFVKNLPYFIQNSDANVVAKSYLSFYPQGDQESTAFIYNDLYQTGKMFVGPLNRIIMVDNGSGYGASEIPSVTFTSIDGGTGASGTALMGLATNTGSVTALNGSGLLGRYTFEIPPAYSLGVTPLNKTGDFVNYTKWSTDYDYMALNNSLYNYPYFYISGGQCLVRLRDATGIPTGCRIVPKGDGVSFYDLKNYNSTIYISPYITGVVSGFNVLNQGFDWLFFKIDVIKAHEQLNTGYTYAPKCEIQINTPEYFTITGAGSSGVNGDYYYSSYNSSYSIYNKVGDSTYTVMISLNRHEKCFIYSGVYQMYLSTHDIYGNYITSGMTSGIAPFPIVTKLKSYSIPIDVYTTGTQYYGLNINSTRMDAAFKLALNLCPSRKTSGTGDYFSIANFSGWTEYGVGDAAPTNYYSGRPDFNIVYGNLNQVNPLASSINNSGQGFFLKSGQSGIGLWSNNNINSSNLSNLNTEFTGYNIGDNTSLAFWIKFNTLQSNYEKIIDFFDSSIKINSDNNLSYSIQFYNDNNQLVNHTCTTKTPLVTGQWYFITARNNYIDKKIYFSTSGNGLFQEKTSNLSSFSNVNLIGKKYLSIYQSAITDYIIDDIRVWNKYIDPKSLQDSSYYYVTGISLSNSGLNYNTSPTITINSPTGGGIAATAYSTIAPDTTKWYADSLMGLSVGGTDNIVYNLMTYSGSGIFYSGYNDFLRIGNTLPFKDWTVFLNFSPSQNYTGISEVILATKDSINQSSGLLIGLTDSNRLFVEYINNNNFKNINYLHNKELNSNNIISISCNTLNNSLIICNHNLANNELYSYKYNLDGYVSNCIMYLGGFYNSGNNTNYTGYVGAIQDFLLLSGTMDTVQLDSLSRLFYASGYIPSYNIPNYEYFATITGANLQYKTIGTGVTGYSFQQISIPDRNSSSITVYGNGQVTGNISGSGISLITGATSGVNITYVKIDESILYDSSYIKQYSNPNLILLNSYANSEDLVEVYSFNTKNVDTISITASNYNISDFYTQNTGNINVYNNGLLQISGIDYAINSGKIISSGLGNYEAYNNVILYDAISGNSSYSGWTGWIGGCSMSDPTQTGTRDIYLNGQKLISGFDYTITANNLNLTASQFGYTVTWASGYFAFVPKNTGCSTSYLSGLGYWNDFSNSIGNLMDSMVFLNGQRLIPNIDYLTVSPFSLLNTDYRPSGYNQNIYSGDIFNLSFHTTKPNINNGYIDNNPIIEYPYSSI